MTLWGGGGMAASASLALSSSRGSRGRGGGGEAGRFKKRLNRQTRTFHLCLIYFGNLLSPYFPLSLFHSPNLLHNAPFSSFFLTKDNTLTILSEFTINKHFTSCFPDFANMGVKMGIIAWPVLPFHRPPSWVYGTSVSP